MGQTLTHGVYLPDEGERNCYNGLAANWQLLDNSVGTIAEHTTALAGKAPAVHTHTKSDITDFPAYGNAAGTICEGNDSRLSDARTPVAHTHGKADVTDLFNSANVWSGDNSFLRSITLLNQSWSGPTPPASAQARQIEFKNADTRQGRYINRTSPSSTQTWIETIRHVDANTAHNFTLILSVDDNGEQNVWPYLGDMNLGNSNRRIKTLNGINPGALSLPDYDSAAKINFTSTFPAPDSNGNIFFTPTMSGWLYVYFDVTNATSSGSIFYAEIKDNNMNNANAAQIFWRSVPAGDLPVFFPVIANKQFIIQINFTGYTVKKALIIPGMGHVA